MSFSNFLQTCGFVQHITPKSNPNCQNHFSMLFKCSGFTWFHQLCASGKTSAASPPQSTSRLKRNQKARPHIASHRTTSRIPHIQMHWSLVKLRSVIPTSQLPVIFQLLVASLEKLILQHQCSIFSPHSIHQVSGSHLDGFGQETIGSTNLRCRLGQNHRTKVQSDGQNSAAEVSLQSVKKS